MRPFKTNDVRGHHIRISPFEDEELQNKIGHAINAAYLTRASSFYLLHDYLPSPLTGPYSQNAP